MKTVGFCGRFIHCTWNTFFDCKIKGVCAKQTGEEVNGTASMKIDRRYKGESKEDWWMELPREHS